jgi:chromosome segregation ATPase
MFKELENKTNRIEQVHRNALLDSAHQLQENYEEQIERLKSAQEVEVQQLKKEFAKKMQIFDQETVQRNNQLFELEKKNDVLLQQLERLSIDKDKILDLERIIQVQRFECDTKEREFSKVKAKLEYLQAKLSNPSKN